MYRTSTLSEEQVPIGGYQSVFQLHKMIGATKRADGGNAIDSLGEP